MITIEKSKNPKKKLDVLYDGELIKSIGQAGAMDYHKYMLIDPVLAKKKQTAYYARHRKGIEAKKLGEVLSWNLLWN